MWNKFVVFFFIGLFWGFPQMNNSDKKQPVKQILTALEKEFEVRFSYDAQLLDEYSCPPFTKEITLAEKLDFLRAEIPLDFEQIDERYIIIKEKAPEKNIRLCGYLLDKISRMPVPNATVWVEKERIGVSTDAQGYFELEGLQSDWILRIDYLGYYSKKTEVYKLVAADVQNEESVCNTIVMEETNEELEEVLISDYLTQGMSKKRDGAIRISPRSLGILPGLTEPDILQSLQLLPGVQSPGETASDLHIRGGTPDHNLVLFDGIKMYESGHFFGLISSFNPYITQKIDFYRSGTSAKFGDRIGGVLDISSGESVPELSYGFGVNLLHADAYIKAPLFNGKVGVLFSVRRSLTDFFESITYKSFSESVFQNTRIVAEETLDTNNLVTADNTFFFHDYNLKVIADLSDKDKLVFSNLYNKNDLEYSAISERFRETINDQIGIQNRGSNLKWSRIWSPKWQQQVEVSSSYYEFDYYGERTVVRKNPENNVEDEFVKYNEVGDFSIKYDIAQNVSERTKWTHGYQFSQSAVDYRYENTNRENGGNQLLETNASENQTHAFFTEYSYQKDEKWDLNLGLRVNYFNAVAQTYLEPRFSLSNQLSEAFQLKFSAEVKNQVVSQIIEFRNNGLGLEDDIWAISNNVEIPTLQNYQLSGGLILQKNGWNVDIDFYTRKIEGLTLLTEDLVTRAPQYLSGISRTNGMDFLLKKRFGNYRSWISYTLSKTLFTYDGINNGNSFDGTYDIPHSFVWSHTYTLHNFDFSLGWKLRSGTPYTKAIGIEERPDGGGRIIYEDEINSNRLPAYKKVDFSATYKFKLSKNGKSQGKIGISLLNVFNTTNILDRYYETQVIREPNQPEERILVETDQLSIGFTPNLVFRASF